MSEAKARKRKRNRANRALNMTFKNFIVPPISLSLSLPLHRVFLAIFALPAVLTLTYAVSVVEWAWQVGCVGTHLRLKSTPDRGQRRVALSIN